jgi:thioredoxin-like negative regulator of GroEL
VKDTPAKFAWYGILFVCFLTSVLLSYLLVTEARKDRIVLVYSNGCGHCSHFAPKFEKVTQEFPEAKVVRLNIATPGEYERAKRLGADATPTVFVLRGEQVVGKLEGDVSENAYRKFLQKHVTKPGS